MGATHGWEAKWLFSPFGLQTRLRMAAFLIALAAMAAIAHH